MSNDNSSETPSSADLLAETTLRGQLVTQFPELNDKITIQRIRRVWAEVSMDRLHSVLVYVKEELGYLMLCTITGTDEGEHLGLMYHLANESGVVLTLVTQAPKNGPGPLTVTPYFPHAALYEREVIDLLGIQIQGLPEGARYPLPDGWPEGQYPLRKDWTKEQLEPSTETPT